MPDFETPAVNPPSGVYPAHNSTSVDYLFAIKQAVEAMAGGNNTGGGLVGGATEEIERTTVTLEEKRFISIERKAGATGSVIIDAITYGLDDELPIFPMLENGFYHRPIKIDATRASGIVLNYINK